MKNRIHPLAIALTLTAIMSCNSPLPNLPSTPSLPANSLPVNQPSPGNGDATASATSATPTPAPSYDPQKLLCYVAVLGDYPNCINISNTTEGAAPQWADSIERIDTGVVTAIADLSYFNLGNSSSMLTVSIKDDATNVESSKYDLLWDDSLKALSATVHASDGKDYIIECLAERAKAANASISASEPIVASCSKPSTSHSSSVK